MNFRRMRQEIYDYNRKNYAYIFEWPWYSYRKYKAILYMEAASFLVYFLSRTPLTPNGLTFIYMALCLISGVLLAIPLKSAVFAAILIMFLKPILDWADGHLARVKHATSISGDILDSYSAHLSWVVFWTGLGLYLGNSTNIIFYYLAPLIPAILAVDIYQNAHERFIYVYFTKKEHRNTKVDSDKSKDSHLREESPLRKLKLYIDKLFEHNARTVDLICLIVLIELFTQMHILWLFYIAFLGWQALGISVKIYSFAFKRKTEDELEDLRKKLYE